MNTHGYTTLDWYTLFKRINRDCDGVEEVSIGFDDTEFYSDQIVNISSCAGRPVTRQRSLEIATLMHNLEIISAMLCGTPVDPNQ